MFSVRLLFDCPCSSVGLVGLSGILRSFFCWCCWGSGGGLRFVFSFVCFFFSIVFMVFVIISYAD